MGGNRQVNVRPGAPRSHGPEREGEESKCTIPSLAERTGTRVQVSGARVPFTLINKTHLLITGSFSLGFFLFPFFSPPFYYCNRNIAGTQLILQRCNSFPSSSVTASFRALPPPVCGFFPCSLRKRELHQINFHFPFRQQFLRPWGPRGDGLDLSSYSGGGAGAGRRGCGGAVSVPLKTDMIWGGEGKSPGGNYSTARIAPNHSHLRFYCWEKRWPLYFSIKRKEMICEEKKNFFLLIIP